MPSQKFESKGRVQALHRDDLEDVFELLRSIYKNQPSEFPMGGGWTRSMVREELESGCGQGYFDAAGYLRGLIMYRRLDRSVREISVLGSHPNMRGQGVMTQLLKTLHLQIGSGSLWLEVHEKNLPAIHLYEKLGFQKKGLRPAYYRDGGAAVLYSLEPVQAN